MADLSNPISRKFLAIADETDECHAAVLYAARRAAITGGGLVLLRVIEPLGAELWASVGDAMREEAKAEAQTLLENLAALVSETVSEAPELIIAEGEIKAEIGRLLDRDVGIRILVLGAGVGRDGPGPLVTSLSRGGFGFGSRKVPVTVVPGSLSDAEISAVAG